MNNSPYRYPTFYNHNYSNEDLTLELLEKFKIEVEEYETKNEEEYKKIVSRFKEIKVFVEEIWGTKSKEYKYIVNMILPFKPNLRESFNHIKSRYEKKQKEEEEKKLLEKRKEEKEKLLELAILFLQERSRVLGKDFSIGEAIETANEIAFYEECEKIIKDSNGWIKFAGNDYCENCRGWDGKDKRCDCGNRRVSWEEDSSSTFMDPIVWAVAY